MGSLSLQTLRRFSWIVASLILVAGAQPDWSCVLCVSASLFGYALFWRGLLEFTGRKKRFCIATLWFALISAIHLSWLTSDRYTGGWIYFFFLFICLSVGMQFGLLSLFVKRQMKFFQMLVVASMWSLFEWSRLFFLSGYTWNPVGLALSGTLVGMQMASAIGVFGMSFWIMLTNLACLEALTHFGSWQRWLHCGCLALMPYIYGGIHLTYLHHLEQEHRKPPLSVILVQTAIQPESKAPLDAAIQPVPPDEQWRAILQLLKPHAGKQIDLIAFSEAVVPYGTDLPIYQAHAIAKTFKEFFGSSVPMITFSQSNVGNSAWVHTLADTFQADVAIGLEDVEGGKGFNAAFLFKPFSHVRGRYEKRILLPVAEYFPFAWLKQIAAQYGIQDCFTAGEKAKVFTGTSCPVALSICYEESFGHLMRDNKKLGAKLLVNVTNDVWYPSSRLPIVHYLHGRLRTVEMGIPLIRACNTGVTCGIDSLGRTVASLKAETASQQAEASALHLYLSTFTYPTLYTLWGDWLIIVFSIFWICVGLVLPKLRSLWFARPESLAENKPCLKTGIPLD